jgi:hypothetical protein
MNTTAFQTKNIAETDTCPLWIFHTTVGTLAIARNRLDNGLIARRHLHHFVERIKSWNGFENDKKQYSNSPLYGWIKESKGS